MIKIYSDKTNKFYPSLEEANKAEFELKEKENLEKIKKERELAEAKERKEKLAAERKARAAEIEDARKEMVEAQHKYKELVTKFTKDYGTYHFTSTSVEDIPTLFNSLFDWL